MAEPIFELEIVRVIRIEQLGCAIPLLKVLI